MAPTLTIQQIELLRRIDNGLGLLPYVLRPSYRAEDVAVLKSLELIVFNSGRLAITDAGSDCLGLMEPTGTSSLAPTVRVMHGRDHSISVEYWPQEHSAAPVDIDAIGAKSSHRHSRST